MTVTVCIPSIPTRSPLLLSRAIPSVLNQTRKADALAVVTDNAKEGAWVTRNKTIDMVNTKWLAFLDDDDELLPNHIEYLTTLAEDTNSDVVWGWFEVVGGTDPFPMHRGRQWDVDNPHIFPITALVNAELVKDSGARFLDDSGDTGNWLFQDFPFWKALWDAGGKFTGSAVTTWKWHHHSNNTSGLPTKW